MQKLVSRMVRLFMVFAAACCIMAGAGGAMSVKAAQTSQVNRSTGSRYGKDTAQDDGSGVMLLLGGMLIIILAVVITVAATVVVAAPAAADEV